MSQGTETARSVPRPRRRSFRYSLGTMLGLVTVLCLVLGLWVERAERQRRAVAAVRETGGFVAYDYDLTKPPINRTGPDWLYRFLAVDYYANVLKINWPKATDAGLAHFGGLTKLEQLYLSDAAVTDAGLMNLGNLTSLKRLSLSGTSVTDAGIAHLTRLTALEDLDLEGTRVTDVGLARLSALTNLRYLCVDDTEITPDGLMRLYKCLPDLWLYENAVAEDGAAEE
jgi:hypothetical protein